MEYRYGSHTVYKVQYHFVFVTKYRYQLLKGDVGLKVGELIRQTCQAFEIKIVKGVVSNILSQRLTTIFGRRLNGASDPYPDFQSVNLTHRL